MTTRRLAVVVTAVVLVGFAVIAHAEDAARPLEARIQKVEGTADVKIPDAQDWQPAARDQVLPDGSEIFTGAESHVEIAFEDSSVVVVQSLSHVKIDRTLRSQAKVNTDLDVKIGEVGVEVRETGLKTDFRVRTPDFTVSIRGSELEAVWVYEIGSAAAMRVHTADVIDNLHPDRSVPIHPGDRTDSTLTAPVVHAIKGQKITALPRGVTGDEKGFNGTLVVATGTVPSDLSTKLGRPATTSRPPENPEPPPPPH